MAEKLSDLAGAKPVLKYVILDVSGIIASHRKDLKKLVRVLFDSKKGFEDFHIIEDSNVIKGQIDMNLLPYYKYRLETTESFHEDNVISEFIGNVEKYLINTVALHQEMEERFKLKPQPKPVSELAAELAQKRIMSKEWSEGTSLVAHDPIAHPSYYDLPSGRESKDVIRDFLGDEGYKHWVIGTSLKYIARYANKELPIQDIGKSIQYLEFLIDILKEQEANHEMDN